MSTSKHSPNSLFILNRAETNWWGDLPLLAAFASYVHNLLEVGYASVADHVLQHPQEATLGAFHKVDRANFLGDFKVVTLNAVGFNAASACF